MWQRVCGLVLVPALLSSCRQPALDTAVVEVQGTFEACSLQFTIRAGEPLPTNADRNRLSYVATYAPELIGIDELWCEYEGTGNGTPEYMFVVAPEMSSDLLRRVAVSYFGPHLTISAIERTQVGAVNTGEGRVDMRDDSPGFFGVSAVETSSGQTVLVLVASAADRSPAMGEPLGILSYELLVAFLDSQGVRRD